MFDSISGVSTVSGAKPTKMMFNEKARSALWLLPKTSVLLAAIMEIKKRTGRKRKQFISLLP